MSFSSLEAGHAESSGAALYPLRTLVPDLLERGVRAEVAACDSRADGHFIPSDWLRSDDSPLLIHNVEEFLLDPDAHLRTIADRLEGTDRARQPSGRELTGAAPRQRAKELQARLRTLAELDAERILATPRLRGTPKGKTRTHYVWLVSPDRDISNADFKRLILEIIHRRWPGAVVVGYIHRDTDNTHLHLWLSAETTSGKKIDVTRAMPSGDAILDKYPDLDEEVARAFSSHFNDPSIYNDHIAKKREWVYWRERFKGALRRGERPPVMPYRARHDYDWVGERRAVSDREKVESRRRTGKGEKAGPVPRAKSLMGALELWGKTIHLEARVRYRRELLTTLDVWRDQIGHPVEGLKKDFEKSLAEAERDYVRHVDAFERTLENRALKEYPELKYPLHNSKQIAEMEEIARLTRDAELLRHARSYTELDRPVDTEGQVRGVVLLWRDHVEAQLEVLERAEMLLRVAGQLSVITVGARGGITSNAVRDSFDRDGEIVKGWLNGGWSPEQMRDSLTCLGSKSVRLHAERYLKAREFSEVTSEMLAECREGRLPPAVRPALEESHLARIERLLSEEVSAVGERERALLLDLASSAKSEHRAGPRETTRLLESSLRMDVSRGGESGHARGARGEQDVFRPHEDDWAGRLARLLTLRETEALALAVSGTWRERFDAAREDIYAKRGLLELTRAVRASLGIPPDAPGAVYEPAEERVLEKHLRVVADGLRARGAGWDGWQAEGVGEFKHVLPKRDREEAGYIVEEVKARLEQERRAEALRRLESQLESAAQFYLRVAYRDEGLKAMREPGRRREHARGLAERFSQIADDAGHDPEELGLGRRQIEAQAEGAISEAVERFAREEREAHELGRLEAQMILAFAARDEAAARRQSYADHAYFYEWNYRTRDGRGSISLCEFQLSYGEETDPAARLVMRDAASHVVRSINEFHASLSETEAARIAEAEAATRAYEARAAEVPRPEVASRGPVFEPDELARLEEAAVVTRDHELMGLVARCEEERYGPEYAAARALGRALRAAAVWHVEHSLPERFEHPVAARRLEGLPGPVRESVSELLARHRAAREAERAASVSFREGLETQASERAGEAPRTWRGAAMPLVTEAEAREIWGRRMVMNDHQKRSWDQMTMYAEVAVKSGVPRGNSTPSLHEWGIRYSGAASHGNEYERGIGDTKVMSYSDARALIRQQEKELGRNRQSPSRGR